MKKVNVEKTKQVRGGFVVALAGFVVGIFWSRLCGRLGGRPRGL
ncbi:hypothetical protein [Photobacterium leiognathi]|nr:hypothetical protein [Photobacterium leiognathi]